MEKRNFFISYNNENDGRRAAWIAETLEEHGFTVYYQDRDCMTGMDFLDWMNDAIQHTGSFIAVLSESYEKSDYCNLERNAARQIMHQRKSYQILPVYFENYRSQNVIFSSIVCKYLLSPREAENCAALLDAVGYSAEGSNPRLPVQHPVLLSDAAKQQTRELYDRNLSVDAPNRDTVQTDRHPAILLGATAAYAAEYEASLINHPQNPEISLRNLYICPNYKYEYFAPKEKPSDGDLYNSIYVDNHCLCADYNRELKNVICGENEQEKFRFIFIEGSPGCGKSSLAAYMSYHYREDQEKFLNGLFTARPFIVIRMRDLNQVLREGKKLYNAILEYLKADSVEQVEKLGAVFFLDGYDELQFSITHQVDIYQDLIDLTGLGWRIIG